MAPIRASNRSPILIPRKQIWEKVFHLMSWRAYDACMHDTKGMKWYVVHIKIWPIMIYYWTIHKQILEEKGRKKQHLNLIRFFYFSFCYSKIKYHSISRKKQNVKPFLYFFKNSKHIFLTSHKEVFSNPNDVVKFISTKKGKLFSIFFFFFLVNFIIESHYLDHPLFKKAFFVQKTSFWSFSTRYFFNNTFLF